MRVTLVLDPSYGESLTALPQPLWACDSQANRLVAERLWSKPSGGSSAVTVFARVSASAEPSCADVLPTIDEHHPGWTEIAVVGALATPALRACFTSFAPGQFLESPGGFTFVRLQEP